MNKNIFRKSVVVLLSSGGVRGRERGKGWVRSGDLLEIRIGLRGTQPIIHPERGLQLRGQGLGWARLYV